VRQLVELHGGSVHASSRGIGLGSEFVVRLPLAERSVGAAPSTLADQPTEHTPLIDRVLIVDDNVDAAEAIKMLVADLARTVEITHTGAQALQVAEGFRPQLVLLDLGLPRMDGYEVARRLRANPELKEVVIAAVTGYGQNSDRERTRSAGFDDHLVKPVSHATLKTLLGKAARRSGGR
jgi:two-component system, chemotaxis family, CheB/CheR fusion protein